MSCVISSNMFFVRGRGSPSKVCECVGHLDIGKLTKRELTKRGTFSSTLSMKVYSILFVVKIIRWTLDVAIPNMFLLRFCSKGHVCPRKKIFSFQGKGHFMYEATIALMLACCTSFIGFKFFDHVPNSIGHIVGILSHHLK